MGNIVLRLAAALGIGFLIGAERERRKGEGPSRSPAGIRTFALASLSGAVSLMLGGEPLLAVTVGGFVVLCAIGYHRTHEQDPGLTSEAGLVLTVLLGALSWREPAIASGLAVAVAIVLAAREPIHHFVRAVLTEEELQDALIFAAATLVILPLVPDRYIGPFAAINPRTVWKMVILMMSISAAGYIAVRTLGMRFGLPAAGFASGFVSSIATIGTMGTRARQQMALSRPAIAGAVLSTLATIIEMAVVLSAVSRTVAVTLMIPLMAAGGIAALYAALFMLRVIRHDVPDSAPIGRAFSLKTALIFAGSISLVAFASAALNWRAGKAGVLVAATVAGFADAHSTAISVASLVASGKLAATDAAMPVLAGLTTNTITKVVVASLSGGRKFAIQLVPGLLLVVLAAWVGFAVAK